MPPVFTKMENALNGDHDYDRKRKEAVSEVNLDLETEKFFDMAKIWCRSASMDFEQSDEDIRTQPNIADRRSTRPMLRILTVDDDRGRGRLTPGSSEDIVDGLDWTPPVSALQTDSVGGLPQHSSLPYGEKLETEKEKIAKQVAAELNQIAVDIERRHGPKPLPSVSVLLGLESYESFSSTISEAVGTDPSAAQLALFFRLTRDILQSDTAKGVVGWAKEYYRQKLAPWVADQNGLESCVDNAARANSSTSDDAEGIDCI